jgi:exodeoxyribonuclease V alpha subunit
MQDILEKLSKSKFRSRFKLKEKDKAYVERLGIEKIRSHAIDFISKRIAPAEIPNDGKQTPMRNHPVFIAQHATATCCRKCINKWHKFPMNVELNTEQQEYIVNLIMEWIDIQMQL